MNGLPNLQAAIVQAASFVQATWQQVVTGATQVPGIRPIKINSGMREAYAKSIITSNMLVGQNNVTLRVLATAQIAKDLEEGKGPWDMKPMLLGGPKARVSKHGIKYNIIPFRHGTSDGPSATFNAMPNTIYAKARELKATVRQGAKVAYGDRLKSHFGTGINLTTDYEHKAPIHEGMIRIEKTYAKAKQSKYLTFRVVSEKSDPRSWWHPGYEAYHIAQGVSDYCQPTVNEIIREGAIGDLLDFGSLSSSMIVTRG